MRKRLSDVVADIQLDFGPMEKPANTVRWVGIHTSPDSPPPGYRPRQWTLVISEDRKEFGLLTIIQTIRIKYKTIDFREKFR